MTRIQFITAAITVAFGGIALPANAASVYRTRLDDPKAVYLTQQQFSVRGDGQADDSAAVQAAIDRVQETDRARASSLSPRAGIASARTIYVWPGIRVIGYGEKRPVFRPRRQHAGFPEGDRHDVLLHRDAAGSGPQASACHPRRPARFRRIRTSWTPTPARSTPRMSNIDFEIGEDNAAAVAVRFHVAQHGYLSHIDFHTGSGLAASTTSATLAEDLHFFGGRYGILTRKPSAAWQFTLHRFHVSKASARRRSARTKPRLTVVHSSSGTCRPPSRSTRTTPTSFG